MTTKNAQQWIQKNGHSIPALAVNHEDILEIFEDELQEHNLPNLISIDPGLCLELFKKVNARRDLRSGLDPVESPQSALSLLGDQSIRFLFKKFPLAEQQLTTPEQYLSFLQIINRSLHNKAQSGKWASFCGYKQIEPFQLASMLAYTGELLCCCQDFDRYKQYLESGKTEADEERIFGFSFDQLTLGVMEKFNFPDLMIRSIPINNDSGKRSQLIKHLSLICKYCDDDWYSEQTQQAQKEFAEFLQQAVDNVVHRIHQFSVQAARERVLKDSWHAAARLILLPEEKKPAVAQAANQAPAQEPLISGYEEILKKIRDLLKNPKSTQSQILNACIHGIHDHLGFTKVNLLLLSKDQITLQSRMNVGLNAESPLGHFKIEVSKAGLLKSLLSKPQAIWINSNTFKKYHKFIPQSFQASIRTNNFVAMSLFINDKPIGIIYADYSESSTSLNQELFNQFKTTIATSSKALTFIAKRSAPR